MSIGSLDTVTALSRPDLLAPGVAAALAAANGTLPADDIGVAEIDPELADTAAFCERYDVALSESANCVVVTGRRDGEARFAACVVLATTRADVNGVVRRQLDVRKASFATVDLAVAETGMEYGGITPIGLPAHWPVYVDAAVAAAPRVVVGSGVRRSKLSLPGVVLGRLPGALVLDGRVADERDRVDQGVRDDQRGDPAPPPVQVSEDQAHRRVAEETAEALVQVVGAAQHGAEHDRAPRCPAQLVQPAQQIPKDQDFLENAVLRRVQDQYRDPPPDRGQVLRHDVKADPELVRDQVQAKPGAADEGSQHGAPGGVSGRLAGVQAHVRRRLARPGHQVDDQRDRGKSLRDPDELQDQVKQRTAGSQRPDQQGLLLAERLRGGQRPDQLDQRPQATGA